MVASAATTHGPAAAARHCSAAAASLPLTAAAAMPELPEVEGARRLVEREAVGKRIDKAIVADDSSARACQGWPALPAAAATGALRCLHCAPRSAAARRGAAAACLPHATRSALPASCLHASSAPRPPCLVPRPCRGD